MHKVIELVYLFIIIYLKLIRIWVSYGLISYYLISYHDDKYLNSNLRNKDEESKIIR